jgi:hypothetical protein
LYPPLCDFLARQVEVDGRKLQSIVFFRDFQTVNPIGAANVYTELKSIAFYRYDAVKRVGGYVPPAPASSGPQPAIRPR